MRNAAIGTAGAALLVFAVPAFGDFWTFVATLAVVYALVGMSVVVLTGWTGQLNLHVAALGLGWGAYASFALQSLGASPAVSLLAAAILTVPFSLAVGLVAVRFRGLELAVATLAIGLTFEQLVFRNIASWLGSRANSATPFASSFVPVARPGSFESDHAFYLLALALSAIVYVLLRNLARGSTRRAMLALREREVAAEVAGVPALRYRTGAFVLSIAVAGLAGALFAGLKQGIAPESFDLNTSFLVLAAVVIGGIRTLRGGVAGGVLAAVLPEVVRFGVLKAISGERLTFLFGAGLVATLAFRPQGVFAPRTRRRPRVNIERSDVRPRAPEGASLDGSRSTAPAALRAQDLHVRFGGVQALGGVDLAVPTGEICALIGPNGAGKTTLFNCLSGIVTPDRGRVYVGRDDVTDMAPHRRAALGLGRTFQSVELFDGLTVLENLMVSAHAHHTAGPVSQALLLPVARRSERALAERSAATLHTLGIADLASAVPGELTSGDLRRVELGCVLVREPDVLLLDEPTAGLDTAESAQVAALVSSVRDARDLTVLLVEHDMAVVGDIADWVVVLDFGRIIAAGTPSDIRRNELVVSRYLGEEAQPARGA